MACDGPSDLSCHLWTSASLLPSFSLELFSRTLDGMTGNAHNALRELVSERLIWDNHSAGGGGSRGSKAWALAQRNLLQIADGCRRT